MCKCFEKLELGCKYRKNQILVVGAVRVCVSLGVKNQNKGLGDFMGTSRFYRMVCSQDKTSFPLILLKPCFIETSPSVTVSPLVASSYVIWTSSLSMLLNLTLIHSDKYDAIILTLGYCLSKERYFRYLYHGLLSK